MSDREKEHHDRLLQDPVYRANYLAGRLNAQLGRALVETTPEQREVTLRYVDMAAAVRKNMNDTINLSSASPKQSLGRIMQGSRQQEFISTLRTPGTRLWVEGKGEDGKSVRVELRLNVGPDASDSDIDSTLKRLGADGFLARVGGVGEWKPLDAVRELEGWVPSEETGLIIH